MTIVLNGDTGITSPGGDTQAADTTINGVRVGRGAGAVATNTAVGASALAANTTGADNSALGRVALGANTTGNENTALGEYALQANTTGNVNTAVGVAALTSNTTGSSNVAVGERALNSNTTASNNTAVGYQAGYTNTTGSVVAIGNLALYSNSTGTRNVTVGNNSLYSNTTGAKNVSSGFYALNSNTTGSNNVALGDEALTFNTTASNNTAVGYQALYSHVNSDANSQNTAIGYRAGYLATGYSNAFIGGSAGANTTTGIKQTFVGYGAGADITTGSKNTILGGYSGNQGGLDIRTASNYIVLSDGDGNPRQIIDGSGNVMVGVVAPSAKLSVSTSGNNYGIFSENTNTATTSNYFYWAYSGATKFIVYGNGGIANYQANNVNLSDRTEKTDFAPAKSYLETICAIPVQTFKYIDQQDDELNLGVIAQDVQAVAPELVTESNWGTKEDPKMRLSIYQTDLQYALMKSIQELKAIVDAQAAEIATLKGQP